MTHTIEMSPVTTPANYSPPSLKMSLSVRHARYTIGMAAGVLCTLLLLVPQSYPSRSLSRPSGGWTAPAPLLPSPPIHTLTPIQTKLEHQEDVYFEMVQSRYTLIRKFGPTPEKLQAFPDYRSRAKYVLWDFFPASFNCPYETERIGALGDGGKWMCGLSRVKKKANCVVYSAGISTDSSFEAELVKRTNCEVFGFDFSVKKFGPEVENYESIRNKTHFYPIGISGVDHHDAKPPMWTLQALMQKHGHTFIDILKLDIEGSEFDTLTSMIRYYQDIGPLPFGQLQLEIHANKITFVQFLKWWGDLENAGLRPFWTEPNLLYVNWLRTAPALAEYSFLNIGADHAVVQD